VLAIAQGQRPADNIAGIESLIRSQKYNQALAVTQADLRTNPRDASLWTLEGVIYSLMGDDLKGISAFKKALTVSPKFSPALKGEIQLLYSRRDDRAIPLLKRQLAIDANDQTAHEMLAMLERKHGDCQAAVAQFALSRNSVMDHPESVEGYGDCLYRLDEYQDAVPVFEKLVELLPNAVYPRYDLALVLFDAKQYEQALKVLVPLLAADKSDADLLSLASQANEATGKIPEAVSLLRQAIVLSPRRIDYYVAFAIMCLDHDSFQVGIDMMNAGIKYNPENAKLYISRGLLYAQLAEYDEAEADFARAEPLDSKQSTSLYAGDLAIIQRNNPDEALARLRGQLKAHPDSPLLNFLLAKLLMNQTPTAGSVPFHEAMRLCQLAIKMKPDLVDARDLLASMYMSSGQFDLAAEECRQALRYVPTDETATYRLLISLRHAGKKDELPDLVKRLSELHKQSLQKELDRKKYRLVEDQTGSTSVN
jgi:tetratricopeptide (TPR) repeat protein